MPAIDLWRARSLHGDIDHVLIDEETLQRRVNELGQIMSEEYSGKDLLLVSVLKGSLVFMADLIRSISIPHAIDFMATSSYGAGMDSSGIVRIMKDLNYPITGRNVVLVEDIIDSGHTLEYLVGLLVNETLPACASCPFSTSPLAARSTYRWIGSASQFPMSSSSVTAWTMMRSTETCHTSAYSNPVCILKKLKNSHIVNAPAVITVDPGRSHIWRLITKLVISQRRSSPLPLASGRRWVGRRRLQTTTRL